MAAARPCEALPRCTTRIDCATYLQVRLPYRKARPSSDGRPRARSDRHRHSPPSLALRYTGGALSFSGERAREREREVPCNTIDRPRRQAGRESEQERGRAALHLASKHRQPPGPHEIKIAASSSSSCVQDLVLTGAKIAAITALRRDTRERAHARTGGRGPTNRRCALSSRTPPPQQATAAPAAAARAAAAAPAAPPPPASRRQ